MWMTAQAKKLHHKKEHQPNQEPEINIQKEALKKTCNYLRICVQVSLQTEKKSFVQKLIWLLRICNCATLLSIASNMHIITARVISGAFIRCMILRTDKVIRLKISLTQFARWSS